MEELTHKKEAWEMPCWSDDGSIEIIDDIVVVKFADSNDDM